MKRMHLKYIPKASFAIDPNGRFVAIKCDLSGSQITIASVYAHAGRQERTPFFQGSLLPALPAGTRLEPQDLSYALFRITLASAARFR